MPVEGIESQQAVKKDPITEPAIQSEDSDDRTIGSLVTVVASCGLLLANEVIKDLTR